MKKKIIFIAVIAIPILLIGYAILSRLLFNGTIEEKTTGTPVRITSAQRGDIKHSLHYSGTLKPNATITVMSKVPGIIEKIMVQEGDIVKKDSILIQIEADTARLQMEQTYSAWQAAKAQYDKTKRGVREEELENTRALVEQAREDIKTAKENYKRSERLYKSGTIAKAQFEEVEREYNNAQTKLENAERSLKLMEEGASQEELVMTLAQAQAMEAQYKLARLNYNNTSVKAPISGVVARIMVDQGNMVGQATPIILLIKDDPIIVDIELPEIYYEVIKNNSENIKTLIKPAAFADSQPLFAKISNISSLIDPKSRTFTLELTVDNADGLLRPGMYTTVEVVLMQQQDTLLIPASALIQKDDKSFVYLAQHNSPARAVLTEIETGIITSDRVEVLSGLDSSSIIIYEGNAFLEDGQLISIVEDR